MGVLASYFRIMLYLHTFHSLINVFIARKIKNYLLCVPGKQVLTRVNGMEASLLFCLVEQELCVDYLCFTNTCIITMPPLQLY